MSIKNRHLKKIGKRTHATQKNGFIRGWSDVLTNFLNLLLFLATATLAGLGYLQWRTMNVNVRQTQELIRFSKQQAEASVESSKAASDSALAARQSTRIAEQSTSIAQNEYLSSRMVTFKATLDEKSQNLLLMPVDNGVLLQEALVYFAEDLLNDSNNRDIRHIEKSKSNNIIFVNYQWIIPPTFEVHLQPIFDTCCKELLQDLKPREEKYENVGATYFPIPIVISSSYLVKGTSQKDISIYRIHARYHVGPKKECKCRFEFLNLFFVRRLAKQEKIEVALEQEWHKVTKQKSHLSAFPKETGFTPYGSN